MGVRPGVGYGRATGPPADAPGVVRRNGTGVLATWRCTGAGDTRGTGATGATGATGGLPVRATGCAGCAEWCCPAVVVGRTVRGRAPVGLVGLVGPVVEPWGSGAGRCVGVPVPWADDGVADGSSGAPGIAVLRCTTGA